MSEFFNRKAEYDDLVEQLDYLTKRRNELIRLRNSASDENRFEDANRLELMLKNNQAEFQRAANLIGEYKDKYLL